MPVAVGEPSTVGLARNCSPQDMRRPWSCVLSWATGCAPLAQSVCKHRKPSDPQRG